MKKDIKKIFFPAAGLTKLGLGKPQNFFKPVNDGETLIGFYIKFKKKKKIRK
ncbi:MAG: hypothetical protein CM15mP14_3410 [Rhodospirillaceae bacterium]|nr:MAG: hypothetical protein CM15mP14_3410 [Rhodospirillaceae bacterium]